MKKNLLNASFTIYLIALSLVAYSQTGGVSINKTNAPADPSAMLDVSSTSSPYLGMLIPRMTTTNRNSIIAPATGLMIFNTDCGINEFYTGTCWISMGQVLKTPDQITCSGTTDFCAGESRTLSIAPVTGATNYVWTVPGGATINSGQGTTSVNITFGNNTGDVCVTAGNLCEASPARCMNIVISPVPPTPGPITGPVTIQPGTTAAYFVAAVSGAGVYNWTVPAGASITSGVGTTAITVSFSCNAVSGYVAVAAQNSCGSGSPGAIAVTVNPKVIANAGPSISGQGAIGGSPTASAGTIPYTYLWTPSLNLSNPSVANPFSTACTTTTYTVTVTDANGCTASSSTTASNPFLQLPTAGASPNPVCEGGTLTLTTSAVSGATYSWSGPGGFTANTQGATINNIQTNQSGNYTVTATLIGCTETSSVTITVNALPASTFTPLSGVQNTAVTFTPTVSGAAYNWTFTGGSPSTSTAQNPSVTWSTIATYNVTLTVTQNGCSSTTTTVINITSPLPTSGLVIWLKADAGVSVNGNSVTQWNDQSGNNNHFFQNAPAYQPTLVSNHLNGLPVVRFDGTNDSLSSSNSQTIGTAFIVAGWEGGGTDFPDYNGMLTSQDGSGPNSGIIYIANTGSTNIYPSIFSSDIFVNGVQTNNFSPISSYKVISGFCSPVVFNNLLLGNDRAIGNRNWNGGIAEVLIYNTALSTSDRQSVENYLKAKWGL